MFCVPTNPVVCCIREFASALRILQLGHGLTSRSSCWAHNPLEKSNYLRNDNWDSKIQTFARWQACSCVINITKSTWRIKVERDILWHLFTSLEVYTEKKNCPEVIKQIRLQAYAGFFSSIRVPNSGCPLLFYGVQYGYRKIWLFYTHIATLKFSSVCSQAQWRH